MFDNNRPSRSPGLPKEVVGDLTIKRDYYPWVTERFIGGHVKRVNLVGEGGIYLFYKAPLARQVYFEPVLHSEFLVSSVGPRAKVKGNYVTFTYPDGSVDAVRWTEPNFRKLQAIRLAAEKK